METTVAVDPPELVRMPPVALHFGASEVVASAAEEAYVRGDSFDDILVYRYQRTNED